METNLDTRLETLLLNKHFEHLSAEEKKYALGFLSQDEYNEYAFLLSQSKATLLAGYGNLQPSPKILQNLKQAFNNQQNTKTTPLIHIFAKPIYQALTAAALLIIIIGLFIISPVDGKKQLLSKNPIKQAKIKTDNTFRNERPLTQTATARQLTASIKTSKKHTIINKRKEAFPQSHTSPVYANAIKNNDDANLCMDIQLKSKQLSEAEPSTHVPCLNTMLIIPGRDTP
jgi:hypothetical protein